MKQTALLLDYSDPYVFSRQFTKYTAIAPSACHVKPGAGQKPVEHKTAVRIESL